MNIKVVFVSSLLIALFIRVAVSQPTIAERSEISGGPKTKLEAFTGTSGAVVIRQLTNVGASPKREVSVSAVTLTNARSGGETKGLLISVGDRYGSGGSRNSFVDYDEILDLLSGIEYITRVDLDNLKLEDFEATYQTRSNLSITVYSYGKSRQVAIRADSRSESQDVDLQTLDRFRNLIIAAKKILDNPDLPEAKGRRKIAPEARAKPEVAEPQSSAPAPVPAAASPAPKPKAQPRAKNNPADAQPFPKPN
jgi:hypothetical protein